MIFVVGVQLQTNKQMLRLLLLEKQCDEQCELGSPQAVPTGECWCVYIRSALRQPALGGLTEREGEKPIPEKEKKKRQGWGGVGFHKGGVKESFMTPVTVHSVGFEAKRPQLQSPS